MITFYTLFPDRLNLNGDQANVFVLQQRLAWQGVESEVVAIDSLAALQGQELAGKFLLIGHGSNAAMRTLEGRASELRDAIFDLARAGLVGLAVGSGYELLFPDFTRGERLSDYADVPAQGWLPQLFGYINTDTNLPAATVIGDAFVCTMVHGPVLARSPELADKLIEKLGVVPNETKHSIEADGYATRAREH